MRSSPKLEAAQREERRVFRQCAVRVRVLEFPPAKPSQRWRLVPLAPSELDGHVGPSPGHVARAFLETVGVPIEERLVNVLASYPDGAPLSLLCEELLLDGAALLPLLEELGNTGWAATENGLWLLS